MKRQTPKPTEATEALTAGLAGIAVDITKELKQAFAERDMTVQKSEALSENIGTSAKELEQRHDQQRAKFAKRWQRY